MTHHVYITDAPDGKFYIGCSKKGPDSDYVGSGKQLKKYDKSTLQRSIYASFEDREEAHSLELNLMRAALDECPELCLFSMQSLRDFGAGESSYRYGKAHTKEWLEKASERMKGNSYALGKKWNLSSETRAKISVANKRENLSPETLRKRSEAAKAAWARKRKIRLAEQAEEEITKE